MNIKNTFVVRQNNQTESTEEEIDAIQIIEYFLSLSPYNRIDPNSILYATAVKQYNTTIKNTLIRPPIPTWFCGKVNPTTNELELELSDRELRELNGINNTPQEMFPSTIAPRTSGYMIDSLLKFGTPGSPGYVSHSVDPNIGLSSIPIPVQEFDNLINGYINNFI